VKALRRAPCAFCRELVDERSLSVAGECRGLAACAVRAAERGLLRCDERDRLARAWQAYLGGEGLRLMRAAS